MRPASSSCPAFTHNEKVLPPNLSKARSASISLLLDLSGLALGFCLARHLACSSVKEAHSERTERNDHTSDSYPTTL